MANYATAWEKWFPLIEGGAAPLSQRMIELAKVAPGQALLDLATGIGEPALTAAQRVGPAGRVLGVDISAEMLTLARRRADAAGLRNLEFQESSFEALTLPSGSYHAIFCRWGLMFATDLPAVLSRLRRLLKPGGRFVAAVWGPPETVPGLSLAARVVHEALDLGPADEGPGTAFALADVDAFKETLRGAGFLGVRGEWVAVTYRFPSAEVYIEFRSDCQSSLTAKMAPFPAAAREAAWQAVARAAEAYRDDDGGLTMVNRAYCVVAEPGE